MDAPQEEKPRIVAPSSNPVDTPLSKSPPVEPFVVPDEVSVKQEWVEFYKEKRLPMKQKHQLQLKEMMWLKTKVKRLGKQMHQLKNQVKKYKRWAEKAKTMMTEVGTHVDEVTMTFVATQIDPIEYFFKGHEFSISAEVQTWKSTTT